MELNFTTKRAVITSHEIECSKFNGFISIQKETLFARTNPYMAIYIYIDDGKKHKIVLIL